MNKVEKVETQKAINTARPFPRYAAATLAGVMRTTRSQKSFLEMVQIMNECGLRDHMEFVGGCFVAKAST